MAAGVESDTRREISLSKGLDGWWYCDTCQCGIGPDLSHLNGGKHAARCPAYAPSDVSHALRQKEKECGF